jgi:hypothetical protein
MLHEDKIMEFTGLKGLELIFMKVILFHLKTVPTEITFGKGTLGLKGT